jgi:DNA-binding response OmpR family regulator
MTRHVVLVVSSRPARLDVRQEVVRRAGHWPLPASSIRRALFLACKIRPSLVLVDADLVDGRAVALLAALRTVPALAAVCLIVLGELTPGEQDVVAHDLRARVRPVLDSTGLRALLAEALGVSDCTAVATVPR